MWYGLGLRQEGQVDDDHDGALDDVEIFALLEEGLVHGDDLLQCAANFDAVAERFRDALAELPQPLEIARVIEVADRESAVDAFAQGWPITT